MMESKEEVNIGIRSVLNSSSKPLTVNELYEDYQKLNGKPVPVKKFGNRCLYEYLLTIPDIVVLDDPNNSNSIVRAVSNDKSKHITNLVRRQKITKPQPHKFRNRGPPSRNRVSFVPLNLLQHVVKLLNKYPEGLHIDDFRDIVEEIQQKFGSNCDFYMILNKIQHLITEDEDDYICLSTSYKNCEMNHCDRPNAPTRMPHVEVVGSGEEFSEDDFDVTSSTESEDNQRPGTSDTGSVRSAGSDRTTQINSNASCSKRDTSKPILGLVSDTLIKNLYTLLDENPNGIWLMDLSKKYQSKFGYSLNAQQHGFDCVFDLVSSLKDVFHIMQFEKAGDFILKDARKVQKDGENEEQGELPKSVVNDIRKMILRRSKPQIFTDELANEYRKYFKTTLDPTDYGFEDMNCLLKSLSDNESSIFDFKTIRNRVLISLQELPQEENNDNFLPNDSALPENFEMDFLPKEVCDYDFKLPVNPILKRLTEGVRIKVKLAEVYTPERFYLHFVENLEELNIMMENLHQFYEVNGSHYEVYCDTVRRNMLCACPFSGNSKWHRVIVVNVKGNATVKVRFIDYGTVAEEPVSKLRYLHKEFAKQPAMSIRAKLNGIKAKPNAEQKCIYTREVSEEFYEWANVENLEAEIVNADLTNQFIDVILYASNPSENRKREINIKEELIKVECVDRKEIDNEVQNSNKDVETMRSTSEQKKKNRPPPGIPIPSSVDLPAEASTSSFPSQNQASTVEVSSAVSKDKFSAVPPSTVVTSTFPNSTNFTPNSSFSRSKPTPAFNYPKMNPLNPPFYPSSYSQPVYQPVFTPPMPPPLPPSSYMYGPPLRPYVTYAAPSYDYCYYPRPPTPQYAPPSYYDCMSSPKPPPGFDHVKPTRLDTPVKQKTPCTGDTYCRCGLDCSMSKAPKVARENIVKKEEDNQPEWVKKLTKLHSMIEEKKISPTTANRRISHVIDDINHDSEVEIEQEVKLEQNACSGCNVDDDITDQMNNLSAHCEPIENRRKSESYSIKSEASNREEIKKKKIEQLRLFVMVQNRSLKKT